MYKFLTRSSRTEKNHHHHHDHSHGHHHHRSHHSHHDKYNDKYDKNKFDRYEKPGSQDKDKLEKEGGKKFTKFDE